MKFSSTVLISVLASLVAASPVGVFPTSIGWLGSTATASAPMLVETDAAAAVIGKPKKQHVYPNPIETSVQSFDHKSKDRSIFELMATLSPTYVKEDGFGVYNYGLPDQCTINQVHVLQRHGARYPDASFKFPAELANATDFKANGKLAFLNDWKLEMGKNILTNLGNTELFTNGNKGFFRYGKMLDWDVLKEKHLVARTTSQQRMMMTAQYYLTGFFGLNWGDYVDLEIIIENSGFNNTLAGWNSCPNNDYSYGKTNYPKAEEFKSKYLSKAVDRFNKDISGFTFTAADLFEIQTICAYETSILGFSNFCSLYSQEEWEGYEYYQSINWYAQNSFGNPMGRALGMGWIEEFKDRLLNTTYSSDTQAGQNITLDSDPDYFPLGQNLYLDFAHDSSIHNVITGLGFEQFKANWTFEGPKKDKQFYDLSSITPFGAQMVFEVIECDTPVPADRSVESVAGNKTQYIHTYLNDNTLSLSKNIPGYCEDREDGWCEFGKFSEYLETLYDASKFDFACTGTYNYTETVFNGVPV